MKPNTSALARATYLSTESGPHYRLSLGFESLADLQAALHEVIAAQRQEAPEAVADSIPTFRVDATSPASARRFADTLRDLAGRIERGELAHQSGAMVVNSQSGGLVITSDLVLRAVGGDVCQ